MFFDELTRIGIMFAAFEHPDVKSVSTRGADLTDEHIAYGIQQYFAEVGGITDDLLGHAVELYRKDEAAEEQVRQIGRMLVDSIMGGY